jgi:DNA ligase-associated metallophosphoesterase
MSDQPTIAIHAAASGDTAAADILLLPGRAALLPASRTLLVADLHLGKAATFRRAGIPVPEGSAQGDLARLERLVAAHGPRRIVILGDLFHARSGATRRVFDEFAALRSRIAGTEVVLVLGNHDRSLGSLPAVLGIDACLPVLDEPPFSFVHEPASAWAGDGGKATTASLRGSFTFAGHLHPTVTLRSPGGDRLSERCFAAEPSLVVLPAFGSFTGGHAVRPTDRSRLWIARDDAVVDVTRLAVLSVSGRR